MSLSGNVGNRFDVAEATGNTTTGTIAQSYQIETSVGDMTLSTSDYAVSLWGYVGANSYQLDLNRVVNVSGAGTGIDVRVVRDQNRDFSTIKYIAIHNTDTAKNLTIVPGSTTSWFPASEQITLKPGMSVGLAYSNAETVGASTAAMSITGSAASTLHEIYILGT